MVPASAGDMRDVGLIRGSGGSPGEGHGHPLWYCCLENPKDRGAWWAMAHRVSKSWTQLSTHTQRKNEHQCLGNEGVVRIIGTQMGTDHLGICKQLNDYEGQGQEV